MSDTRDTGGHSPPSPQQQQPQPQPQERQQLRARIEAWCTELGFSECRVADLRLDAHVEQLHAWLAAGLHGEMDYMATRAHIRAMPQRLLRDARCAIVVRMDYLPPATQPLQVLQSPEHAYVSRYALGRDYHKIMRPRLGRLVALINRTVGHAGFRACVDSAPVMEKALADRAGMGWYGKNTLILNRAAGSWFFLGVVLTDLDLPVDTPTSTEHCGSCNACLSACPTGAFIGPRQIDARRCISYLTIELDGSIPHELRPLMGNRVFGCDDCQLVCPWNRYAQPPALPDFLPRNGLDHATLLDLFAWSADDFEAASLGSPLRRIGYTRWLRNLAVALGNALHSTAAMAALTRRIDDPATPDLVREHYLWALARQRDGEQARQRDGK